MRLTSLISTGTIAALGYLAFAGSLASALSTSTPPHSSAPVPSTVNPSAPRTIFSESERLTQEEHRRDLAAFAEFRNNLFTISPKFTVIRPENTHLDYQRDVNGLFEVVTIVSNSNGSKIRVSVRYLRPGGKVAFAKVEALGRDGRTVTDFASIRPTCDVFSERVTFYEIETPRGAAHIKAINHPRGISNVTVVLDRNYRKFMLQDVEMWDGEVVPIEFARHTNSA
ncbi:hypothetical protein THASP1DRAFT_21286 [Thamnocephalis sphaerospora]|uniref:Uncharacterized protein n=1 Tax=Thamnocephalis sphaerospora TaxID=78915 RepID=A0A4P9XXT0_9FUNG|nr:hypothetical protein THASP1DRAFT_21286 [Thamnocephalis sphaerospora]|eukprot:RKP11134.1 hypothetical protein THASP1DRAFT_21286 [Thamnocephalis sphaerospora]